ncbi:MAG: DUF494 family protein [Gemmatimonadota bacterium]
MSDRLSVILTVLRERFAPETDVAELEAYLSSEGFDRLQIGKIVSAFRMPLPVSSVAPSVPAAFRVIGPHEQGRFNPDAWGLLLSQRVGGVMGADELEGVIDRLLSHVEGRVTVEDVRAALEAVDAETGTSGAGPGQGIIH